MTDPAFAVALNFVLHHEGGLVDDSDDPGGITNMGISLRSNPELSADDIRNMTRARAGDIYLSKWWLPYGFGLLPPPFGAKVFDEAVNMGARNAYPAGSTPHEHAIGLFQHALNICGASVAEDGMLGQHTAAACRAIDPGVLEAAYSKALADHYRDIVAYRPVDEKYLGGWLRRADDWDVSK